MADQGHSAMLRLLAFLTSVFAAQEMPNLRGSDIYLSRPALPTPNQLLSVTIQNNLIEEAQVAVNFLTYDDTAVLVTKAVAPSSRAKFGPLFTKDDTTTFNLIITSIQILSPSTYELPAPFPNATGVTTHATMSINKDDSGALTLTNP